MPFKPLSKSAESEGWDLAIWLEKFPLRASVSFLLLQQGTEQQRYTNTLSYTRALLNAHQTTNSVCLHRSLWPKKEKKNNKCAALIASLLELAHHYALLVKIQTFAPA